MFANTLLVLNVHEEEGMGRGGGASFAAVFAERAEIEFVLLGTGPKQAWPDRAVRQAFADNDLVLECMDTGAAVRTYNVLLSESRTVAAARP